jgi:outer membrane translocation and assembly module TamA
MKKITVFAMVFLLIAGIAYAKDYEVKKKAGQYDVEVKIDKNPPVVGKNNVSIEIKDESGKHVTDATVKLDYSMPAMPGMPAMNYKTDATVSGNTYKAVMNLSMSGPWNIAVKIKKDGKTNTVKFNVDAH